MARSARRPTSVLLACAGTLLLAACGSLGIGGDESTRVILPGPGQGSPVAASRQPLSIPPILQVRPGTPAPVKAPALQGAVPATPPATGQDALLKAAGARSADPQIRDSIEAGAAIAVPPPDVLARVIGASPGTASDIPQAERLASRPLTQD